MSTKALDAALRLPLPERIQLVQEIWDSVVAESACVAVTKKQKAVLDRRLADLEANPGAERPWSEVLGPLKQRRCPSPSSAAILHVRTFAKHMPGRRTAYPGSAISLFTPSSSLLASSPSIPSPVRSSTRPSAERSSRVFRTRSLMWHFPTASVSLRASTNVATRRPSGCGEVTPTAANGVTGT